MCVQHVRATCAAAADERLTPVRIVSRVGPQKPAPGATQESLRRPTPQDIFDDKPLEFDSDWLTPIGPEAGGKQKATICGESGDVNYKLPKLLPRQTTTIKASWKVPDTPGKARVRFFIDSACAVFNESADFEQWTAPTTVLEAGTKYALLYLQNRQSDGNWSE
ncbi:hypothetical protein Rsub_05045 [Raphidocelis subcapitata]|uniref:Uncharacterized protein n=1 Tax=Raphidocelis subcapitata TaxID=307507 RepID=A0A2V0NYI3_9CHLO|nr:hypothetical protein Rsub_05045 [Raphidocelis subcapitata]|eukprot:GBF92676.1 hypothetical protein Rsub_05045 [Raphidocelis subcapitata]